VWARHEHPLRFSLAGVQIEVLRADGEIEGLDAAGRRRRRRLDREVAVAEIRGRTGERVHIEDFAQVFGVYPEAKYERASYANIARVLWLESGERAIVELTRRLVFNALIGNADAHLKNWSVSYPDGRSVMLAPAYDLVATVPYIGDDRLALSLGDTKVFADIDLDRFTRFARRADLPDRIVLRTVRETAERVRDLWPNHEPARALPDRIRRAIDGHLQRVPL